MKRGEGSDVKCRSLIDAIAAAYDLPAELAQKSSGRDVCREWAFAKPALAHGLAYERAHTRRVRTSPDRDETDIAPEFRLYNRQAYDA